MIPQTRRNYDVPSQKAVLAFSGGLDTSFCVPWLRERGWEVITVFVDTGGVPPGQAAAIGRKAKVLGAARHVAVSAEREIYDQIIAPLLRSHALYEGAYPLMCSDRYVIVETCAAVARREGARAIAHGCTGMGNDQARFDIAIRALGDFEILAPIRDFQAEVKKDLRAREIDYLAARGFDVPAAHRTYSINRNVFGVTISGSEIDALREPDPRAFVLTRPVDRAPAAPGYAWITFERGLPVALDGRRMSGIAILRALNGRVGRHGCGRSIYTGDCVIGIKGRIAFECPGLAALMAAHRALAELTLSKEQNLFLPAAAQKWAYLQYSGLFHDPLVRDLNRFFESANASVNGRVRVKAHRGQLLAVAVESPDALRQPGTVYAQASAWAPAEAEAFVKLFGIGTVLAARRDARRRRR
jgi:argininosuccinate synthase